MSYNIRYVKLTCTAHYDGSGTTMQFTGPFFINSAGTRFVWPSGTTYTSTNVAFSVNEYPTNAIGAGIDGKACGTATNPFTITWDMQSAACDISTYNRVQIYTSNDTATVPGRNLRNFKIEVSDDGTNWYTVCNAIDAPRLAANYSVQYTSPIFSRFNSPGLYIKINGHWRSANNG